MKKIMMVILSISLAFVSIVAGITAYIMFKNGLYVRALGGVMVACSLYFLVHLIHVTSGKKKGGAA